jgi:GDP/UDP-N,N'-diacetylbacillosamine 2-epimerase (hydrolysing)
VTKKRGNSRVIEVPGSSRRICFVTGTRAEFGLMRGVLRRIRSDEQLKLQIMVTGMHLDRARGSTLLDVQGSGWHVDRVIPWRTSSSSQMATAASTGRGMAGLAHALDYSRSDIVLVVGDRAEAFAAASAAHIGGRLVAHVHGGDRALGLVDDSLRHAITKLAHIHFPATAQSATRIARMGEDPWRIFRAGSPGLDGIRDVAAPMSDLRPEFRGPVPEKLALLVLHPQTANNADEAKLAQDVLKAIHAAGFPHTVIIYPNNDPGSVGIARTWDNVHSKKVTLRHNLPRDLFLGVLREAAVLVGNSSSGIIEAASFGTPVIDIGTRQSGRERGPNVIHVPEPGPKLRAALARVWRNGKPIRFPARNLYGGNGAAEIIARTLATIDMEKFRRKIIAY